MCGEGLTATVTVSRVFEDFTLVQHISLDAHSAVLRFDTRVEWHALHRLLKVSFPVTVSSDMARHEMQFGYVERPTHRSRAADRDRFEVCNHRYTALCDSGHGCAVLNDGKYGVSVEGREIELTLLRAPAAPEMRADNGSHRFTYAFTTWEGPWLMSPTVRDGLALNVNPVVVPGSGSTFSAFRVSRDNVIIDTVKMAEDGSDDVIVRLYESLRADTSFTLQTALPVARAWLCDLLETPAEPLEVRQDSLTLNAGPFKVLTVRLALQAHPQQAIGADQTDASTQR